MLRPRLLPALHSRFETRVVGLVASAGFGKSTLMTQAVQENRLSPAGMDVWLTCSSDHDALSLLVGELLTGLSAPSPADPPTDPHHGAQLIAEAVLALAPRQVALIVDDLHTLAVDGPGLALIGLLIDKLPASGHLVVASRPPLRLPLARLVARGSAILLDEDDLAFADDELMEFAVSRGVDASLLAGLSGWPALAELVVATGRRQVVDFLWEEVLGSLSEDRIDVLAVLAAVGGADDLLASELLQRPVELAATLAGLPLVEVGETGWWSLHPLWESALRVRQPSRDVRRALAEAPSRLRARGLVRQSMRVLIEQGSWADLEPVILDACAGIAAEVPADVLNQWYHRLPEHVRATGAGRLLAGTAAKRDDPTWGRQELLAGARQFQAEGHIEAELACLLGLFHISFWRNDLDGVRRVLQRWRELSQEGVTDAQIACALGTALTAEDPETARRSLETIPAGVSGSLSVLVDWMRAHLLLLTLGEPERAAAFGADVLERAPITLRSSIRCELVEANRMLGRRAEARRQVGAMLRETTDAVVRSPRHLTAAIVLAAFGGERARARHLLTELHPVAASSHLHWADLAEGIATAALHAGDSDERARQALQSDPSTRITVLGLLRISTASLPLYYVLQPDCRSTWETAGLRGSLAGLLRLAQALVEVREGGDGSALPRLSTDDLTHAASQLPIAWGVRLGVALVARGRLDGVELARSYGTAARAALHELEAGSDAATTKAARRVLGMIPPAPAAPVDIRVFGALTVTRGEVVADDANSRRERVRQLLGYLVVHRSAPRHRVAATLWPDLDDTVAARNLRVTLNYLQQVLEPERDERDAPYFLRARGTMLELVGDPELTVDLWVAEQALDDAEVAERQGIPSRALAAYLRAAACHQGGLLADLPADPWLIDERDRLRSRFTAALVRAGNLLSATGDHPAAEQIARQALGIEPWSEEAYHVLVSSLLARGDRPAARRALDRCFDMLIDLGVEAGAQTISLSDRVRHGR